MEKQIEEMANIVCEMALKPNSCRECDGRKGGCFTIPKMKILYNAGYRKIYDDHQRQCTCYALGCQMAEQLKSKVAEQIFAEIGELVNEYLDGRIYTHDFCTYLAELKKKYTKTEGVE